MTLAVLSPASSSLLAPIKHRIPSETLDRIFFNSMILVLWALLLSAVHVIRVPIGSTPL